VEIDRELLELAAKAAGITPLGYGQSGIATGKNGPCLVRWWNPITDDGDALRLAVKLDMELDCHLRCAKVPPSTWHDADDIDDGAEAMRRAIVRAAAEIGKRM
jgi:hypothetical protein